MMLQYKVKNNLAQAQDYKSCFCSGKKKGALLFFKECIVPAFTSKIWHLINLSVYCVHLSFDPIEEWTAAQTHSSFGTMYIEI